MSSTTTAQTTLAASLLPAGSSAMRLARGVALALAGSWLIALSARCSLPFWPVPVTMQSLAVLVLAAALGSRLGVATVLAYLGQGLVGLPVFAGPGAGPAYLAGPTGGYLVGFVLAAFVVGRLAERGWDRRFATTVWAMALGTALILACGVLWLARLAGLDAALASGLWPFLPGAVVKVLLGAGLLPAAWRFVGERE